MRRRRDVVEEALAKVLPETATAGRFDRVAQLARELETWRLARAENVVTRTFRPAGCNALARLAMRPTLSPPSHALSGRALLWVRGRPRG